MLDLKPPLGAQEISQTKKTLGLFSQRQLKGSKMNQGIWACKENVIIQIVGLYIVHLITHETSLQQGRVSISLRRRFF